MGPNEKDLPATCDGLDDDCDGMTNEGFNVGKSYKTVPSDPCDGPDNDCGTTPPDTVEPNGSPDQFIYEPCGCDGTVDDLCSIIRESCDDVDGDTCDNCPNDEEGK